MASDKRGDPPGRGARPRGAAVTASRRVDIEAARGAAAHSTDPWPANLPVSVVNMLFRLAPRLTALLDLSARDYGIGFARGRVLWALRESGPVVMRAISEAIGVTPRTVTGLVDALEADGLVARCPHPADRRATLVSLTPAAETMLARLGQAYEALAHDLLGDVRNEDLERCRTVIGSLEGRLDALVSAHVAAYHGGGGGAPGHRSGAAG